MAGAGGATAVQQQAAGARASGGGAAGAPVADPRAEALRCPRCDSANTKFCYYNNYSLSQPRHFCKACKRYWTRGGTLRNVPVGGGCRKNKRSRSSSGSSAAGGRSGGLSSAAAAAAVTSSSAAASLTLPPAPGSLPSLTSALGLTGGTSSLASLLLGSGSGADHLGLFQAAMQSVVSSEATAYEMQQQQQQHQSQVDHHLLGLGYGGAGSGAQIQLKPWMQDAGVGAGGIMDSFYAPLLSGSLVPGLEELHVKAEAAGAGDHQQKADQQSGGCGWELPTPSSSNVDASSVMASDALMAAAAASMNPAVSSATTATTTVPSSFMYWGNGGFGGAAAAWPDLANCGSSIATLF
ncbi:hypothetical protein BS78_02G289000 [Paspalum vaginatum]|nr:hypothetical protein BS78_02G289000 [Paspalum vaginatum]